MEVLFYHIKKVMLLYGRYIPETGDKVKIDRLVSIIIVLLRRERVQAKELAEMFDVSVRTILRDIDSINLAGIPIITYQGMNGGISIAEGYRLDSCHVWHAIIEKNMLGGHKYAISVCCGRKGSSAHNIHTDPNSA